MTEMKLLMQSVQQHQVREHIRLQIQASVYVYVHSLHSSHCDHVYMQSLPTYMLCNIIRCYAPFAQFAHCTGISSAISHMHYTCINQYVNVAFSTLHAQETDSNLQHTRMSCQSYPSAPSTNCCLLQRCMTNNCTCILQQVLYYNMGCFPPYDTNTLLCDACIYMLTSIHTSSNCNHKQCTLIL